MNREALEKRVTEAFLRVQRGYSREAEIVKLTNDIERWIKEAKGDEKPESKPQ